MLRRARSVMAAVAVLIGLFPAALAAAADFDDVPDDHVFSEDIQWLADEGITRGCNPPANTRFCADDAVTRGEMAAFLVRALGLTDSGPGFEDTDGHVFEADISKLAEAGITRGCNPPDNTRFCPDESVTRGAMAAFLVRGLELTESGPSFSDTIGHVFEVDISRLAEADITRGCNPPGNTRFCPDDPVTRGAMAAFLHRALEEEEEPETPDGEFDPFTIEGNGGDVTGSEKVEFRIPNDYLAVVDVVYDDPADQPTELESNIIVDVYTVNDEYDGHIVNEIGDYEGRRIVNLSPERDEPVRSLSIDSNGPWTITARPLSAARRFSESISGSGDDVIVYTGSNETLDWEYHPDDGPDNFIVMGYDRYAAFVEYLANAYPEQAGSTTFSNESVIWNLTGYGGEWTLDTR